MTADDNVQMVARLFDAFSRGEIDSILAALSDDVDYFRQFAAISEWHPADHRATVDFEHTETE